MANPTNPATAPKRVKTTENPITKLSEWRNIGRDLRSVLTSKISGPARLARYTGTKGITQGDRKLTSPAPKAIRIDIFSIIYFTTILMLIDLPYDIKSKGRAAAKASGNCSGIRRSIMLRNHWDGGSRSHFHGPRLASVSPASPIAWSRSD